ncbi:hypothetical protein [Candidatus Poriferisodalis sp.]|uniref:hypothetical protein n=1 Tax=Candidatus Poriferisodalis sp. TaxID=3101277 RepID=UPI003B017433
MNGRQAAIHAVAMHRLNRDDRRDSIRDALDDLDAAKVAAHLPKSNRLGPAAADGLAERRDSA